MSRNGEFTMSIEFNKKLGATLRAKRKEKGYSQEYVASLFNFSKNHVSHWEIGKRSMYAEELEKYCEILGCSMQDVFDEMNRNRKS